MSVCGVPKTIDNDVAFIDKSFGFDSAVAEGERSSLSCLSSDLSSACKVINCARIEADVRATLVGASTFLTPSFRTRTTASRSSSSWAESAGPSKHPARLSLISCSCRFVAMYSALASNDVDICLIPEAPFSMDKLCEYTSCPSPPPSTSDAPEQRRS